MFGKITAFLVLHFNLCCHRWHSEAYSASIFKRPQSWEIEGGMLNFNYFFLSVLIWWDGKRACNHSCAWLHQRIRRTGKSLKKTKSNLYCPEETGHKCHSGRVFFRTCVTTMQRRVWIISDAAPWRGKRISEILMNVIITSDGWLIRDSAPCRQDPAGSDFKTQSGWKHKPVMQKPSPCDYMIMTLKTGRWGGVYKVGIWFW